MLKEKYYTGYAGGNDVKIIDFNHFFVLQFLSINRRHLTIAVIFSFQNQRLSGQSFASQSGNAGMTIFKSDAPTLNSVQSGQMQTSAMFTATASSSTNNVQNVNEAFVKVKTERVKPAPGHSVFSPTTSVQQNQLSTDYPFSSSHVPASTTSMTPAGVLSIKSTSEAKQFIPVNSGTAPFVDRRISADANMATSDSLSSVSCVLSYRS